MTVSATDYFRSKQPKRKKEPRYLAVIDKDSCTSCTACASVCPVDCIYEVGDPRPANSYHAIDSSRCIGCQLCYRIPSESTSRFNLAVCPWNAIDLIHNPNLTEDDAILKPYYLGERQDLAWGKLEEYGYQLFLNGEVRIPAWADQAFDSVVEFSNPLWGTPDDKRQVVSAPKSENGYHEFHATEEGKQLLTVIFGDYPKVFLD